MKNLVILMVLVFALVGLVVANYDNPMSAKEFHKAVMAFIEPQPIDYHYVYGYGVAGEFKLSKNQSIIKEVNADLARARFIFNYTANVFDCDDMSICVWYYLKKAGIDAKLFTAQLPEGNHCWTGFEVDDGWIMIETTSDALNRVGQVANNVRHSNGIMYNTTTEVGHYFDMPRSYILYDQNYDLSALPLLTHDNYKKLFGNISSLDYNLTSLKILRSKVPIKK